MTRLFALTIFLGAALLFGVQPLFARLALPLLGGAPAVWNTAMVFFQGVLLLGYLYAHVLASWRNPRAQALVHLAVLVIATIALPIGLPAGWTPPGDGFPALWLLGLMAVSVGLPFFAVSTTSPLLQRWFTRSGDAAGRDPYFLYAASNVGSLLALVAYPLLLEPRTSLATQSSWWTRGYLLLIPLVGLCAWRLPRSVDISPETPAAEAPPLTPRQCAVWILLAFIPSSLMLSVTTYLTTDIASVPLLWLPPLALYLLSFINAFASKPLLSSWFLARAIPQGACLLVLFLATGANEPKPLVMGIHLLMLFLLGCACHGRLSETRPDPIRLTGFYLCLSVGGVLGGLFNALLAPVMFTSVVEYPLVLALALMLIPARDPAVPPWPVQRADLIWAVALGLLASAAMRAGYWCERNDVPLSVLMTLAVPCLLCFMTSKRPVRFGLAVGAVLLAVQLTPRPAERPLEVHRTFFGIHRVREDAKTGTVNLYHGTTLHGGQFRDPAKRGTPLSYYHPTGPCGQTLTTLAQAGRIRRAGVIGLGTGALAAYGATNQVWDFYEIDPAVAAFARDSEWFTYLRDCPARWSIILGDGRLTVQQVVKRREI